MERTTTSAAPLCFFITYPLTSQILLDCLRTIHGMETNRRSFTSQRKGDAKKASHTITVFLNIEIIIAPILNRQTIDNRLIGIFVIEGAALTILRYLDLIVMFDILTTPCLSDQNIRSKHQRSLLITQLFNFLKILEPCEK